MLVRIDLIKNMNILNKYCDNIFVITIDRFNRKTIMNERLKDVQFEFYDGVDGSLLTDEQYNEYLNNRMPDTPKLNRGQLGCALSHINLYKHIYENKLNNVLILEDDAILTDNVFKLDEYFSQLTSYEFIFFGLVNEHINYDKYIKPNYSKNILKLNRDMVNNNRMLILEGTNAYFIKDYNFLKNLIDFQSKWLYTADGTLNAFLKEYNLEYNIFLPQIIKTDDNNISIITKFQNL